MPTISSLVKATEDLSMWTITAESLKQMQQEELLGLAGSRWIQWAVGDDPGMRFSTAIQTIHQPGWLFDVV